MTQPQERACGVTVICTPRTQLPAVRTPLVSRVKLCRVAARFIVIPSPLIDCTYNTKIAVIGRAQLKRTRAIVPARTRNAQPKPRNRAI